MLRNFGFQNSQKVTSHGFLFYLKDQTVAKMKKHVVLHISLPRSSQYRLVSPIACFYCCLFSIAVYFPLSHHISLK
ncbi:hypothetical protein V6Z11_D01G154000 [Gossypium hirsutum]